jgi:hypothetical protein
LRFFSADAAPAFFAFPLAYPDDQGFSAAFLFKTDPLDYDIPDTKKLLDYCTKLHAGTSACWFESPYYKRNQRVYLIFAKIYTHTL